MALADWFEILDKQERGGQSILNVYHVQRSSGSITATDIVTAFVDWVMPLILPIQPSEVAHTSIEVRNLDDPTDFSTGTFSPNVGTIAGSAMTSFTAATIQFNRRRLDMKNGQKRWVAGSEAIAASNSWGATFMTDLDLLGDAIVAPWEKDAAPGVDVCTFGIIKRVCVGSPPPVPCVKYRLPETDGELEFYTPVTFISRESIRSQVSRKKLII